MQPANDAGACFIAFDTILELYIASVNGYLLGI